MKEWQDRRRAALAGLKGDEAAARELLAHPTGRVRATALGALNRMGRATGAELSDALADPDANLRRRACEEAVGHPEVDLVKMLSDADTSVAEAAAWALGERADLEGDGADNNRAHVEAVVGALSAMAIGHVDPLCREAAVASLGALGDRRGLPAILAATSDKPAVRRRAVIALAPFDFGDPEVGAALERARADRDWQVRQAAEDLMADDDDTR